MAVPQDSTSSPAVDPAAWVDRHGDALFAYALLRVRDRAVAEDLVQECFLAALKARERFTGGATERTWLVGILKHKIVDHFRRTPREDEPPEPAGAEPAEALAFTASGFWKVRYKSWGRDPRVLAENVEFWAILRRCLSRLPRRWADAFALRELEGFTGEQVCQVLGLTPTNLWARLHRARLGLRHCLDTHWFKRRPSTADDSATPAPETDW
jgi:RNA polymerase sigma-70 factor (ECF subfamily)